MKLTHTLLFLMVSLCLSSWVFGGTTDQQEKDIHPSSILFMENKGQVLDKAGLPANDVLFVVKSQSLTTFIHSTGISYQFNVREAASGNEKKPIPGLTPEEEREIQPVIEKTFRTQMNLLGANINAQVLAEDPTTYYENYYGPSFPEGIRGIRSFQKITFKDIYPGIDWVIYSEKENLKYDFIVHPGADASIIKMQLLAADNISLKNNSNLSIQTRLGTIHDSKLYCYLKETGESVLSSFVLNENIISFNLDHFNNDQTLVIDPEVVWSTTYGGEGEDAVNAMELGPDGFFYGVGYSGSTVGIAYLGFDSTYNGGNLDIHILKFDTLGNKLWGTYYGGNDSDLGSGIHATDDGSLFICAYSQSADLPTTTGVFQETYGGYWDAFLMKFDTDGNRIWATYAGGFFSDFARGVKADNSGNVYLAGSSYSSFLAYLGHQNINNGFGDQLLMKFDGSGNRIWSTYLGGIKEDVARDAVVDEFNNVYLVGYSESTTNIAFDGFDMTLGGKHDCTLAKFDSLGVLIWSTYYGGNKDDNGNDVELDAEGNLYMASQMSSAGMALDGYQMTFGGVVDAMLTKFTSAGIPVWSTYLGGALEDEGKIVRIIGNSVYFAGYAASTTGVALGGFQNTNAGLEDGFLAKFDLDGNLYWSTYQGGSGTDYCRGVDGLNDYSIYTSGKTFSSDFPTTPGAYHETFQGGVADGFIRKIVLCAEPQIFYEDLDGDGFGNDLITIESCGAIPAGYSIISGDCDDTNPEIYPSAIEICNGLDEDCDFIIDEDAIIATITAGGPTSFCKGGSVTLSANAGAGNTYVWKRNGANIAGATNKDYVSTKSADYTVQVTVPGGCTDLSDITTVIVYAKPNPVISAVGSLDICLAGFVKLKTPNSVGHTFQWYKDGASISGATSNSYTATSIGSYVVKQSSDHGCVKNSEPAIVYTTCKLAENEYELNNFQVLPNPVHDRIIVKLQDDSNLNTIVEINFFNEIGELVHHVQAEMLNGILTEELILPSSVSNGIYLVQAITPAQIFTQQIVVAK